MFSEAFYELQSKVRELLNFNELSNSEHVSYLNPFGEQTFFSKILLPLRS